MKKTDNNTRSNFERNLIPVLAIILAIAFGGWAQATVPDLYINGLVADPALYRLTGEQEDLTFTLNSSVQQWTMLHRSPMKAADARTFGFYTNDVYGCGRGQSILFSSLLSWDTITTNVTDGTDVGFWLMNNPRGNRGIDHNYRALYSERSLSRGITDPNKQAFLMYDVRGFGDASYSYGDWRGTGNYDYLLFIDEGLSSNSGNHDDMVIGLSTVPEPGTLMLLGAGLIGTGLMMRRRRNKI